MKDYYKILDLSPEASQQEIKEQYRLLLQAWHPNEWPTPSHKARAGEKIKEINKAYEVLGDRNKRADYDRRRPSPLPSSSEQAEQAEREARRRAADKRRRQTEEKQRQQAAEFTPIAIKLLALLSSILQLIRLWLGGIFGLQRPVDVLPEALSRPTIEFRPQDKFLAKAFRKSGNDKLYLDVAGNTFETFVRTGADTIVFSTKSAVLLWIFDTYSQAKDLLIPVKMGPVSIFIAFVSIAKQTSKQNLQAISIVKIGVEGRTRKYIHVRVLNRKTAYSHPAAHISRNLDYMDLFNMLEEKNHRYVVLRWFEEPNKLMTSKDIDLLVDDEAVADIRAFSSQLPGTLSIDLHTIIGLSRVHPNNMDYYPIQLASEILNNRRKFQNKFFVPDEETYFKSLAYHALYHKGSDSGIPSETKGVVVNESPKHDYVKIFHDLSVKAGFIGPITMEALDSYLRKQGWQPPKDALRKLSNKNDWVKKRFFGKSATKRDFSLCVFVIRDRAVEDGYIETIKHGITSGGFTILSQRMLSPEDSAIKAASIRGGDWGSNAYPISGGGPRMILATIDLLPRQLTERLKQTSPWLDNSRITYLKNRLREIVNGGIDESKRYSMLHSSDNTEEALEYLEEFFGEEKNTIVKKAQLMANEFKTKETVLADLTDDGKRAKVELIRHGNGKAVKKTFKPGCEEYGRKEIELLKKFSGLRPEVSPILESGENYFVMPFYKNWRDFNKHKWHSSSSRLMPLFAVRQSLDFLKFLCDNNVYLVDAAPGNTIIDKKEGLKFIDLELWATYEQDKKPRRFEESYDIVGLPDESYDPLGPGPKPRSYDRSWKPYTGLTLKSALYDPVWKCHYKRMIFRPRKLARRLKVNSKDVSIKTAKKIYWLFDSLVRRSTDIQ